jgi:hypothetical protein
MSEGRPPGWRTPGSPPASVPLQYERPRATVDDDGPAGGVPFIGQMAIGFGAFLVYAVLVSMSVSVRSPGWEGVLAIVNFTMLLLLFAVAGVARSRWRWRGFLVGVLSGFGLMMLGIGLALLH